MENLSENIQLKKQRKMFNTRQKERSKKMKVTIGKKIASIIVVMTVLIGISGIVGIVNIGKVGRNADIILDEANIIDSIQETRVSFQQLLMPANDYLITGSKEERENFEKILQITRKNLSKCAESVLNHEHYVEHKINDKEIVNEIEENLLRINKLSQDIFNMPDASVLKHGQIMEEMDNITYEAIGELDDLISISKLAGKYDLANSIYELKLSLHKLLMPTNDYLITADATEKNKFNELLIVTRENLNNVSILLQNYKGQIERTNESEIIENVNNSLEQIVSLANRILSIPNPIRIQGSEKMQKLDAIGDEATEVLGKLALAANASGRHDLADSAQKLRISFQEILMPVNDYMIHKNEIEKKTFEKLFASAEENLAGFSKLVTSKKEQEILDRIEKDLATVASLSQEVFATSSLASHDGAGLMEEMDEVADHVIRDLHLLLNDAEEDIREAMKVADKSEAASKIFSIVVLFVLVIAGLGMGLWVSLPIINSIHALVVGTQKIAGGDLTYHVRVKTKDELLELSNSFNQMTDEIQKRNEELQTMNEELQSTNEELESSNEELCSTTEELEASNEELQSTTEELEVSNEELRTANEELETTQEQLVQKEKLAAVGQLASGVGHELRNPLGVIKNAAYYIKTKVGADDPKLAKHLNIMEREINNSNRIISDLLGFSRTRLPSIAPSDANQMVDNAMEVVEMSENVLLVKEFNPDLPKVMADADQIHQVFVNLGLNAVQAMTEGGQLKVKTRLAGDYVEVEFNDTGCGIPAENIKKLFDPFFSTKARGVGLGLAVTHGIVERNKCKIEVKSKVSEGTTFVIKLPVEKQLSEKDAADKQKVSVS